MVLPNAQINTLHAARHLSGARNSANSGEGLIKFNNNNNCSDPVGISMYVQTIEKKKTQNKFNECVGKVHLKVHNEDALDRLLIPRR